MTPRLTAAFICDHEFYTPATPHAPSQPSHPETTAAGGAQD